jgi:hypothetical protein
MMSLFQDDDWFRKLLEDKEILEQLGLPTDMTSEEIDQLVDEIENNEHLQEALDILEEEILNPDKYIENDIPYDMDKTPAENCIEESMLNLGMRINTDEDLESMKIGTVYSIVFPNKKIVVGELVNVIESQIGLDYMFYNVSGAEDLVVMVEEVGDFDEGVFPIPHQFLYSTIIREYKD